jgi:hypothetical protein
MSGKVTCPQAVSRESHRTRNTNKQTNKTRRNSELNSLAPAQTHCYPPFPNKDGPLSILGAPRYTSLHSFESVNSTTHDGDALLKQIHSIAAHSIAFGRLPTRPLHIMAGRLGSRSRRIQRLDAHELCVGNTAPRKPWHHRPLSARAGVGRASIHDTPGLAHPCTHARLFVCFYL